MKRFSWPSPTPNAMHRAAALLLVIILVAPAAAGQVDPNRRAEPELTGEADFVGAAVADFTRYVFGATLDPPPALGEGILSDNLHTNVWFLWDAAGARLHAGHADPSNCDLASTEPNLEAIANLCDGDAVAVAISQNGDRAVVASHISASRSRVILVTAQQGQVESMELDGLVRGIDLDGPGDLIAIAVEGVGSDVAHRVQVVGWLNTRESPIVQLLLENAPSAIDLSTNGALLVFAANSAHRLPVPGGGGTHGSLIESAARDVAVASDSAHWSIAGYASGEVAAFSKDHSIKHAFSRHPSNNAQEAVAIREDATAFAAGDAAGTVRYYSLNRTAATGTFAGSQLVDGSVTDLVFSRDGRYLLAGSDLGEVALYKAGAKLDLIWSDRLDDGVQSVDLSADGEVALVTAGSTAYVYQALHRLLAQPLGAVTIEAGAERTVSVGYKNTGNRAETVGVQPGFPDGWVAVADPATFQIPLAGDGNTSVRVVVPEFEPPGRYTVPIKHSLGGQPAGETLLSVDVPEKRGWDLAAGAPSKAVSPGQTITFPAVLQNLGNVPDNTGLSVTVNRAAWLASVNPPRVDLDPGQSANITVTLVAPADAGELDSATVNLVIEADRSQSMDFTGKVGAAFQPTLLTPSAVKVVQGKSTLVPISVRNDGNAPDSFDAVVTGAPLLWTAIFETGLPTHRFNSVGTGETTTVNLKVQAPPNADINQTIVLRATIKSLGDPSRTDVRTFLIGVLPPDQEDVPVDGEDTPGIPPVAILAALLAAAGLTRRPPRGDETTPDP